MTVPEFHSIKIGAVIEFEYQGNTIKGKIVSAGNLEKSNIIKLEIEEEQCDQI